MPARLLIVDDHEVVRKGVRMLFANNDSIEVCGEAENGMEAVRMVPELSPDVVILDLSMPGMNGFETAAKIRLIAPPIRIVFFSVHEIPNTALWVGADAFVSKSSALQDLVLTVNRVLHPGRWEEHHATPTSGETPFSEIGAAFSSDRACDNDSVIPTEFTERRRQPRTDLSQVVQIRPFDSSFLPEDYTTLNVSRGGLYFSTSKRHYAARVNVYVTSDFRPDNPKGHTVAGVVVRVEKLKNDKWGVAIHIFSPLSSTVQ
jgi:DNA-binding NarL/FixJ family response regulator